MSLHFSRENTPGNTKESVSSNEDYFYNPDLDASFPPVQASVAPAVQEQETGGHNSSHDNSNNNTSNNNQHNVANSNNNHVPHPTDSSLSETTQSSDITNRSKKSKLRLTKSSEPSLSLPPVVILQNTRASEPTETAGFTFGFEVSWYLSANPQDKINLIYKVNESLLAMSSEKDKSDTNVNSDTLNNGDNNISDPGVNSSVNNKGKVRLRMIKRLSTINPFCCF